MLLLQSSCGVDLFTRWCPLAICAIFRPASSSPPTFPSCVSEWSLAVLCLVLLLEWPGNAFSNSLPESRFHVPVRPRFPKFLVVTLGEERCNFPKVSPLVKGQIVTLLQNGAPKHQKALARATPTPKGPNSLRDVCILVPLPCKASVRLVAVATFAKAAAGLARSGKLSHGVS